MAFKFWRFSLSSIAAAVVLGCAVPSRAGRNAPDIGGIIGIILNSALTNQARQEWLGRPLSEYNCLGSHNLSVDQLAARGIGPNDPRVQRFFAQCARDAATQSPMSATVTAPTGPFNSDFVVEGLSVGAEVYPDGAAYKAYKCHRSDEFPGFTWCGVKHSLMGKFGRYDTWVTILHSDADRLVFVLQDVIPAYFRAGDTDREIQRLSQDFRHSARIYNGPARPDAPHSVIATWGDVTLTPLDQPTMDALAHGDAITAGLLIDFLADSRKSAREGMPVFHMGGGNGYIWAAKFDDAGKGRLRITAVNPSLLPEVTAEQAPQTPDAPTVPPPTVAPLTVAPAPAPAAPDPAEVERDRAARAEKATTAAKVQLEEVDGFIKEHSKSPNLIDYIDRTTALRAAIKAGDPDEIERKMIEISASLSHDKDYQQHLAEQAEVQKKKVAQYLIDAIRRGEQERDFILDYIGKNPSEDAVPTFATLVKQLNHALQQADLNQLQPLVDKVDLAVREANLEDELIAAQKKPASSSDKKAETTPSTQTEKAEPTVKIPLTDKNRFLVEGDLGDVEILYNANSSAPHVAQNLRGDFVFAQNQAVACLFGQNPDELALILKQAIAAKVDPRQVAVLVEPCNPEQLLSYDIIATQRNAFLRSKREDALTLIKHIEEDNYRRFDEVNAAALNKFSEAERALIEKNVANIADGAPDGFGIVLVDAGSPNLCVAVGAKLPSHHQLLIRVESKLNLEMQAQVAIKDTTIDDAFISVQKGRCGAIYAAAADLKTLTAAFKRNDIPYRVSGLWNLPSDIDREDSALAEKAKAAAQQETERVQRNEDQKRLESAKQRDLSETQRARQDALRRKFGDSANAAAATLSSEIIAWTKEQNGQIGYQAYAAWLADKAADHWEIITIEPELYDFGRSDFKGRSLDTVFSRITLHMKNRMLGEYQNACFIFGRINDTEFSMSRELAFSRCDDEAAIKAWESGNQFKSEWFASS